MYMDGTRQVDLRLISESELPHRPMHLPWECVHAISRGYVCTHMYMQRLWGLFIYL